MILILHVTSVDSPLGWTEAVMKNSMAIVSIAPQMFIARLLSLYSKAAWKFGETVLWIILYASWRLGLKKKTQPYVVFSYRPFSLNFYSWDHFYINDLHVSGSLLNELKLIWNFYKTCYIIVIIYSFIHSVYVKHLIRARPCDKSWKYSPMPQHETK